MQSAFCRIRWNKISSLSNFADDYTDRLWQGEAKSRGIKIRIPADGIRGKKSVTGKERGEMRDFATERQKERDRVYDDGAMREA